MTRRAAVRAGALLAWWSAVPFFVATTFHGDDHLFLAFARHAPHPFVAFVSDAHGGEYYRPLPMLVWWLLGRPAAGSVPFAALAFLLHAGAAALTALLLRALGRPAAVAGGAAVGMLLAPQNLDAAYWFSASTDLFATVFVLAALTRGGAREPVGARPPRRWPRICPRSRPTCCRCWRCSCLRGVPWRRRLVGGRAPVRAARRRAGGAQRGAARMGRGGRRARRRRGQAVFRLPAGSPTFSPATASCPSRSRSAWAPRSSPLAGLRGDPRGRQKADGARRAAVRVLRARGAAAAGGRLGRRARATSTCRRSGSRGRWPEALAGAGAAARITIAGVLLLVGGLQAAQRRARRRLVRAAGRGGAPRWSPPAWPRGIACSTS